MVNSTVGLSALQRGLPTKLCGKAMYNIEGLTYRGELDDFWIEAHRFRMNQKLFRQFRKYLIWHTQLNGNFYRRLKHAGSPHAGLVWTAPVSTDRQKNKKNQQEKSPHIKTKLTSRHIQTAS